MKREIFESIMKAERKYHGTMEGRIAEAENYVDDCKRKQASYYEGLKYEWYLFEKNENEKLKESIAEFEQKTEAETVKIKEQLKLRQSEDIEARSEMLKKEVLSFIWR